MLLSAPFFDGKTEFHFSLTGSMESVGEFSVRTVNGVVAVVVFIDKCSKGLSALHKTLLSGVIVPVRGHGTEPIYRKSDNSPNPYVSIFAIINGCD